jgi:hypothetical protein
MCRGYWFAILMLWIEFLESSKAAARSVGGEATACFGGCGCWWVSGWESCWAHIVLMNTEPNAGWRYYEGQHRVVAQLDQGVRQTVV